MSSPLLRLLSVVCLLACLHPAQLTQAQSESDTTARDHPPAFQKGGWGLQYEATSLEGALSGFQGSLFSGRYHFGSRQALRVGVAVNAGTVDGEQNRDRDSTRSFEQRFEQDSQRYAVSGEYVWYFKTAERFFLFAGVGPRVSYSRSTEEETERSEDESRIEKTNSETTEYGLGIGGAIGVEWFVHPHVSLSAEYPVRVDYVHERGEMTRTVRRPPGREERRRTTEGDRFSIGGASVRFDVSFSFGP